MIRKLLCWLGSCFEKLLCKIGIHTWYWDRRIHKDNCWHCKHCGKIKR